MFKTIKKLVTFLTILLSITVISMKADFELNLDNFIPSLNCVSYIYYLLYFKRENSNVKAWNDFDNKVSIMTPAYTKKLNFQTQKIDRFSLMTQEMVITTF